MNASGTAGRLLVGLAVVALLGGCAAGASPAVTKTKDVAYDSANPLSMLDVYAPARAGPWPVVVMLYGGEGDKGGMRDYARRVADLGFIVFVPDYTAGGADDASWYDGYMAITSQAACAVEFARAHAAEYGGDPATMIVFGYSGGANFGAMVVFARPDATAGCLGGTTLGEIDALVTWDGNWILSMNAPVNLDSILAAEPKVLGAITPWTYLAGHKDQMVVMLVSENPGAEFERKVGDPWAADSWLAVRDPSGVLRTQLEANGAFADGLFDYVDSQQLLYSVLEAQGNPVSLDVMPGSTHISWSDEGWDVFLAAVQKAATQD